MLVSSGRVRQVAITPTTVNWATRPLGLAFLVFALLAVAYHGVLQTWFGADDFLWLELGTPLSVAHSFVAPWGHGNAWRPIPRLSFYVDNVLFGTRAAGWHVHNVLLHGVNTLLLATLIRRLLRDPWCAALTALVFAVLPLNFENTVWISGRTHLLGACFTLVALLLFESVLRVPGRLPLLFMAISCLFALWSYEASLYVLFFAGMVAVGHWEAGGSLRATAIPFTILIAVTVFFIAFRHAVLAGRGLYPRRELADLLSWTVVDQMRGAALYVGSQVGPRWALAIASFMALGSRRDASLVVLAILVAGFGYAPFLVMTGIGPRALYAANAGLALCLAALVRAVGQIPRVGTVVGAGLFTLLLIAEVGTLHAIIREWQEAGDIGRRTLTQLSAALRTVDPIPPVAVIGAPGRHGRAFVFYTYLSSAVHTYLPRPGLVFSPNEGSRLLERYPEWFRGSSSRLDQVKAFLEHGGVVLRMDAAGRGFEPIDSVQAVDAIIAELDAVR